MKNKLFNKIYLILVRPGGVCGSRAMTCSLPPCHPQLRVSECRQEDGASPPFQLPINGYSISPGEEHSQYFLFPSLLHLVAEATLQGVGLRD